MDIDKLKALALAATPGPWDVNQASAMRNGQLVVDELYVYSPEMRKVAIASDIADPATGEMSNANAEFIAASCPATVLELIAKLDRAERALLRAGFEDLGGQEWKPPLGNPPKFIEVEAPELRAEVEKLQARFEYIEEHATTHGGGHGFTVSFFVPVDCEDIGCGIDAAIAARTKVGEEPETTSANNELSK
jgi:hypothetical protein